MEVLNRAQIIEAARNAKIDRERLTVPELGGDIYVRGMSGNERDKFEEGLRIRKGKRAGQSDLRTFRAKLAVKVVVDQDGKRLLNDSEEDIAVFGGLPAGVLDRIISKCQELSGKAEEEIDEGDALGNASASAAASGDSASSSQSN